VHVADLVQDAGRQQRADPDDIDQPGPGGGDQLGALGITIDGTKVPLGLAEGATENATVVRDLLAGLRDRELEVTGRS